MYYKVRITKTSKNVGSKEDYQGFDQEIQDFKTLKEVKEFLDSRYKKCKKIKMYRDSKNGESHQAGWIYCFKDRDISHASGWWLEQDWMEVSEIAEKIVIV